MRGLSLYAAGWRRPLLRLRLRPQPTWSSTRAINTKYTPPPFPELDQKWQTRWAKKKPAPPSLETGEERKKAYILPMFPYPSGSLHLGHLRVYTISDVLARFHQMQGRHVVHPIGWDAFGLPAENAAMERGVPPEQWTLQNIETMKKQMQAMGGRWDWEREFKTCDPEFYKHTQRIFLMLHERGLAYQAESLVNYDPVDKTVLANEQVDANGCSWRSGAQVEQLMLKQWFLKIKDFQEPLLQDLDVLDQWPERVVAMQKNWLGKSQGGTQLPFEVRGSEGEQLGPVEVFTTRADTLFGVQYIALSLTHPLVKKAAERDAELQAFIDRARKLPPGSKEGFLIKHLTAINPLSSLPNPTEHWKIPVPVYVAPYVLGDYGSGAVMGVPGHDTRDYTFWCENTPDAEVVQVVLPEHKTPLVRGNMLKPMLDKGYIADNMQTFSNLPSDEAIARIVEQLSNVGVPIKQVNNWRLRDWLISRQRYWGTPIPIIHCGVCGPVPVPVDDLPVQLPKLPGQWFQKAGNALAEHQDWKHTKCPKCGSAAERETDTMDTFMDSSWYFFRFLDPHNKALPFSKDAAAMMPVDVYVGGVEHAILHLLYARFITKFLASTDLFAEGQKGLAFKGEPFKKLITQGMVHGKTFSDPETGRFLRPDELDFQKPSAPVIKATGATPNVSFEKMSKSKHNGVDPGATIARYGADITRAHMLFQAPVSDVLEWDESSITGVQRWLARVLRLSSAFGSHNELQTILRPSRNLDYTLVEHLSWLLGQGVLKPPKDHPASHYPTAKELVATLKNSDTILWSTTQDTIANVTKSYATTHSLNTIISDLMTLANVIFQTPHTNLMSSYLRFFATAQLLRLLAPVAPAVAEEGWETLHDGLESTSTPSEVQPKETDSSIFSHGFPIADTNILPLLIQKMTCVVQVDGKRKFEAQFRGPSNTMSKGELEKYILTELLELDEGKRWLSKEDGIIWKGADKTQEGLVPKGWSTILVNQGRLINIVSKPR